MIPVEQRWYLTRWFLLRLYRAIELDRPHFSTLAAMIGSSADGDKATDAALAINAYLAGQGLDAATGILALSIALWGGARHFDNVPGAAEPMRAAIAEFVTEFLRTYSQGDEP
jgi:hypothetical protein